MSSKSDFCVPDLGDFLRRLVLQIPVGYVTTFGRLARALGDADAARGVAHWLLSSARFTDLPLHRVLTRDGSVGDLDWPSAVQRAERLQAEGVPVVDGRVDLTACLWEDFTMDSAVDCSAIAPLEHLRRMQSELSPRVSLRPREGIPERVGGVDLSYIDDETAIAALAIVDVATGELRESCTVRRAVTFPYLTGYLSFREIPLHLALLDEVRAKGVRVPEVLLVDGSGILHARGAGIATHLGIVADLCTVGVTKTFLHGEVDLEGIQAGECRDVVVDGEVRGSAVQPKPTGRPIFVSPGHQADLDFARRLVVKLLCGRRLPSPIWWADRLSREAVRDS